jgi:hypothetical protein
MYLVVEAVVVVIGDNKWVSVVVVVGDNKWVLVVMVVGMINGCRWWW